MLSCPMSRPNTRNEPMIKSLRLGCFLVTALLLSVTPDAKSQALITTPSSGSSGTFRDTIGFSFTVGGSALRVSALGVYDNSADGVGLASSNTVGLWTNTGTLLGSATFSAGTGATLTNNYRWISVTPFDLVSGATYRIGAFSFNGESGYSINLPSNGFSTSGDITLTGAVRSNDFSSFAFPAAGPDTNNPNNLVVRGNAMYSVVTPVPEPATYAAIFGLVALGFAAYRRHRKLV